MTETSLEIPGWTDKDYASALTENRVRAGFDFLDARAPKGWIWNLFRYRDDGRLSFVADPRYNEDGLLARAFMWQEGFASKETGYVTDISVMRKLGLHHGDMTALGFIGVHCEILKAVWESEARRRLLVLDSHPRHETPIDRAWRRLDEPKGFWKAVSWHIKRLLMRR